MEGQSRGVLNSLSPQELCRVCSWEYFKKNEKKLSDTCGDESFIGLATDSNEKKQKENFGLF